MSINLRFQDRCIYLPDLGIYLDPPKRRDFSFVSHAHADHVSRHKKVICTPQTASFMKLWLRDINFQPVPFFKTVEINDFSIQLLPAGHIMGSAQIFIKKGNHSLLYTGDFRTKPSKTAEQFVYQSCSTLIMETTFGLPQYIFPPREQIEEKLINLIKQKLNEGKTPVIYAYALGKSQEILYILTRAGITVAADYQIVKNTKVYERYGVQFGEYQKFKKSDYRDRVLLLPAQLRRGRLIDNKNNFYSIFISGWGIDQSAIKRFGVDEVLPISDHADFNELINFVEQVNPKKVYCTHGFNDFYKALRERGFDARPVKEIEQLELI